ncbi:MAG: Uncharacterized protein G01um101420_588 [Parcubacteria group bacterium Gr01-1014_20]|nr:MAG: Uncharacterized protein G01um101420_588 [Parcubacteria group bacterium Gr01-1014_20]
MKISKKMFVVAALVLLVLIVVLLALLFANLNKPKLSKFSAVYLENGDVYFGKLSWFPHLSLSGTWFIQKNTDQTGASQLNINPFSGIFWGPDSKIYLNRDHVVFTVRLRTDSQVAKFLENPPENNPTNPTPPTDQNP